MTQRKGSWKMCLYKIWIFQFLLPVFHFAGPWMFYVYCVHLWNDHFFSKSLYHSLCFENLISRIKPTVINTALKSQQPLHSYLLSIFYSVTSQQYFLMPPVHYKHHFLHWNCILLFTFLEQDFPNWVPFTTSSIVFSEGNLKDFIIRSVC